LEQLFKSTGYGLTMREALGVTIQAAKGLHHIHELGYVHRDVKLNNLLLGDKGEIKLSDFGIAMDLRNRPIEYNLTGTLAYMAPEQINDKNKVDKRSDIYALGVVLYELLAGRLPFEDGTNEGLMRAKIYDQPPPITDFNRVVPNDLQEIVKKALMAKPEQRYQHMAEFERALEDVLIRLTDNQAETRPANKGQGTAKVNSSIPHLINYLTPTTGARPSQPKSIIPFIIIGAVVLIITIGLFSNIESTPAPSPTPTNTDTNTDTPTSILPPTFTPLPPSTSTRISSTATPPPSTTVATIIIPTDTVAVTATVSPTNLFTTAPTLLEPKSGTQIFVGKMTTFRWQWAGQLPENYNFEVCIWLDKEEHLGAYNVKDTVVSNNNGIYTMEFDVGGARSVQLHGKQENYYWSVAIVQVEPYQKTGLESSPIQLIINPINHK